jgi:hypothetical protein
MEREGRVLHSWKEIADCLGVTVRSAQRWEKESGLPVHRLGTGLRARVFAYEAELLAWRSRIQQPPPAAQDAGSGPPETAPPEDRRWKPKPGLWLAAGVALAAVAAAVVGYDPGLIPALREPAAWRFAGRRLTVLDGKRRVCWEKHFPGSLENMEGLAETALVDDIDEDGDAEVLFNFRPGSQGSEPGVLFCYDRRGGEKWRFRYGRAKRFGDREFSPFYYGRLVRLARFQGRTRVVAVAMHQVWYPAQVALLEPRTGRLEEEYWHPGAIHHCLIRDLDGDGDPELLLGGINNPGVGLGHPGLAVLRLPFSRRREGIWKFAAEFPPVTGGGEAAYAVFPAPDLNIAAGVFPFVSNLAVDNRGRILVQLQLPERRSIGYYLNRRLEVEEFRVTDDYAALHKLYRVQGLLDHDLTPDEVARLGRVFVLPNAPDGNSPELRKLWRNPHAKR